MNYIKIARIADWPYDHTYTGCIILSVDGNAKFKRYIHISKEEGSISIVPFLRLSISLGSALNLFF